MADDPASETPVTDNILDFEQNLVLPALKLYRHKILIDFGYSANPMLVNHFPVNPNLDPIVTAYAEEYIRVLRRFDFTPRVGNREIRRVGLGS